MQLVAAKTRVASLATISIPMLELIETMLGLNLLMPITTVLNVGISHVSFWCDSMNVL